MSVIMRRVAVNYFAAVLGPSPASVKCAEVVNIAGEKVVRGARGNIDFAFGVSACRVKLHTRQTAAVSRLELSAVDLENRAYHDRFEFRALEEVVIGSDITVVFVNAFVRYISVIEIGNSGHFDVLEVRALAERKSVKTGYTSGKRDFLKEFVALERAVTDELNGLFAVNAVVVYVHDRDFGFGEVLVIPYIIRARASVGVYEIFIIAVYHAVIVSRTALTAHVFAVEFVLAAADDPVVLIVGVTPLEARFCRGFLVVGKHVAGEKFVVSVADVAAYRVTSRVANASHIFAVDVNIGLVFRLVGGVYPTHECRAAVFKTGRHYYRGKVVAVAEVPVRVAAFGYRRQRIYAGHRHEFQIFASLEYRAAQRTGLAAHALHVVEARAVTANERRVFIGKLRHALR